MPLPEHAKAAAKNVLKYIRTTPRDEVTEEKVTHIIMDTLYEEGVKWDRQRRMDMLADSVGYRDK